MEFREKYPVKNIIPDKILNGTNFDQFIFDRIFDKKEVQKIVISDRKIYRE